MYKKLLFACLVALPHMVASKLDPLGVLEKRVAQPAYFRFSKEETSNPDDGVSSFFKQVCPRYNNYIKGQRAHKWQNISDEISEAWADQPVACPKNVVDLIAAWAEDADELGDAETVDRVVANTEGPSVTKKLAFMLHNTVDKALQLGCWRKSACADISNVARAEDVVLQRALKKYQSKLAWTKFKRSCLYWSTVTPSALILSPALMVASFCTMAPVCGILPGLVLKLSSVLIPACAASFLGASLADKLATRAWQWYGKRQLGRLNAFWNSTITPAYKAVDDAMERAFPNVDFIPFSEGQSMVHWLPELRAQRSDARYHPYRTKKLTSKWLYYLQNKQSLTNQWLHNLQNKSSQNPMPTVAVPKGTGSEMFSTPTAPGFAYYPRGRTMAKTAVEIGQASLEQRIFRPYYLKHVEGADDEESGLRENHAYDIPVHAY